MIRLFLCILLLVFVMERQAQAQDITHADINFFFDSITPKNTACEFKLSPNTTGMLWRIQGDKIDNTGACQSGQILTLPASASLEIKRKDIELHFLPLAPQVFHVRLTIKPTSGVSDTVESREATSLVVKSTGGYAIYIGKD